MSMMILKNKRRNKVPVSDKINIKSVLPGNQKSNNLTLLIENCMITQGTFWTDQGCSFMFWGWTFLWGKAGGKTIWEIFFSSQVSGNQRHFERSYGIICDSCIKKNLFIAGVPLSFKTYQWKEIRVAIF